MATPKPRVIAMIPARGGSVSIPKKNIKPLAGRPLIDWVIKPAIHSGCFAEVWVSTDDVSEALEPQVPASADRLLTHTPAPLPQAQIAQIAEQCGAKVHWRAPETATSTASTESAILDFVGAHPDYDILCLIQATSPFIAPDDFIQGLELLQTTGSDSLVTAVRAHRFMWSVDPKTMAATAKNYEPLKRPRRQDWDGELIENGAFYLTRKAVLQKHGCRLGGKMVLLTLTLTLTLTLNLTRTRTPTLTPTRAPIGAARDGRAHLHRARLARRLGDRCWHEQRARLLAARGAQHFSLFLAFECRRRSPRHSQFQLSRRRRRCHCRRVLAHPLALGAYFLLTRSARAVSRHTRRDSRHLCSAPAACVVPVKYVCARV